MKIKKPKPKKFKFKSQGLLVTKEQRALEATIMKLAKESPLYVLRILCNAVVDIAFDITGEDMTGGGV